MQRIFKDTRLGGFPEIQSWLANPKDAKMIAKYDRMSKAAFLRAFGFTTALVKRDDHIVADSKFIPNPCAIVLPLTLRSLIM